MGSACLRACRGLAREHLSLPFCVDVRLTRRSIRFGCYRFWALSALPNFFYRLFHPRYLLVNTKQIHAAFFTPWTPTPVVQSLQRLLSPYESMLWPMQGLSKFVTGPDVLASITGWTSRTVREGLEVSRNMLVLAAEWDVLCTPELLRDATGRYRDAFLQLVRARKVDGVAVGDLEGDEEGGVAFSIVGGVGHHLQNHVEWERGAEQVLRWVEKL
jgi:hypothetical protein